MTRMQKQKHAGAPTCLRPSLHGCSRVPLLAPPSPHVSLLAPPNPPAPPRRVRPWRYWAADPVGRPAGGRGKGRCWRFPPRSASAAWWTPRGSRRRPRPPPPRARARARVPPRRDPGWPFVGWGRPRLRRGAPRGASAAPARPLAYWYGGMAQLRPAGFPVHPKKNPPLDQPSGAAFSLYCLLPSPERRRIAPRPLRDQGTEAKPQHACVCTCNCSAACCC